MITNLHLLTEYSFLESYIRIKHLISLAKQYHYSCLAITDNNNMYGHIRFYQHAMASNIKPILGVKLLLNEQYLILLAMNNQGFYEINQIISERNKGGSRFNCVEYIHERVNHCFILTPEKKLMNQLKPQGLNRVFWEAPITAFSFKEIMAQADQDKIPVIPTYPAYFLNSEDYTLFKLLHAIKHNQDFSSAEGMCSSKKNNYFVPLRYFYSLIKPYPEALKNINYIIQNCNVEFSFHQLELPEFQLGRKRSAYKKLVHLCFRQLNKKKRGQPVYYQRLKKELDVIHQLKLESYFLIVYWIVIYARKERISYTGRGSAANSLVCYLLQITFIDPIKANLFFERFLHLKRDGLPDIDLDFPWNKRDQVIERIYRQFKTTNTALISTHNTFNARSAIRETAKVFGLNEKEISRITKRIPYYFTMKSLKEIPLLLSEFKAIHLQNSLWEKIFSYADKLIDLPRHISIHPGGMVISKRPLAYFTAIEKAPKGFFVTQLNMYDIEKLGLLKMDILGQRSLAVIDDTLKWIKQETMVDIPLFVNDRRTINIIKQGQTIGCFYIESPAMRQLLKKLEVKNFNELTAASSVIRPGVAESGMMQKYIEYHRDPVKVAYVHPDLKRILHETYGIMIYQEDVIKVVMDIGGFAPEEADILRKSMSGKSRAKVSLKILKEKFITRCLEKRYLEPIAIQLWEQIESFAGYAFCKAHSASYARLSFIVAHLKTHFPAEFMASVISNRGGFYSTFVYVEEARRLHLGIRPPDVNQAYAHFMPVKEAILVGLSFLKGFNFHTIETIIQQRKKARFIHVFDFINRCDITAKEFLLLTKAGALDSFGLNRRQLFLLAQHLPKIREPQTLLPSLSSVPIPEIHDFSQREKILFELESLEFSCTANPLILLHEKYKGQTIPSYAMKGYARKNVVMLGIKIFSKLIPSKKENKYMKFVSCMDLFGTFETFITTQYYEKLAPKLVVSSIFLLQGKITEDFGTYTLQLNEIYPMRLT